MVFQDRDDRPADGDGRAIERVHEVRPLLTRLPVAESEPPRLVVGAVGGARHLAPLARLAAARHPGLEVELAVGRAAQVAGGGVDHAVGNAEAVEDPALQFEQLVVHRLARFGQREGEHLDLGELVHAVQAAGGPAVGPGLRAETVADAAELHGQFVGIEDPLMIGAPERDLGRGD